MEVMMSRKKPKVGVLWLCAPTHVKMTDGTGRFLPRKDLAAKTNTVLKGLGYDILHYTREGELVDTIDKTFNAVKYYQQEDVDCLFIYHTAWCWPGRHIQACMKADMPILLFGEPYSHGWPTVGVVGMHGAFDEIGLEHKMVYGRIKDERVQKEIDSYIKASTATQRLRKSRFCIIGGRSMEVPQMSVDPHQWLKQFGIDVNHLDQYSLVQKAESVKIEDIKKVYKKLKSKVGSIVECDERMQRSIRLYLGYKKLKEENPFDFATIKCLFDLSNNYCSACLAISMLNDEGEIISCSGDCNGALTLYLFSLLSDQPRFTADVHNFDLKKNILKMVSDGTAPFSLASSRKEISLDYQWTGESEAGGISTSLHAKPGAVTIGRLARVSGEYVMQIVHGQVYEPTVKEKNSCECGFKIWPHAYVKLETDAKKFIQNVRSEYTHFCYGDHIDELLDVCKILKIKPLL